MIDKVFVFRSSIERYRVGPLAAYTDSFAKMLFERGHSALMTKARFRVIGDVNKWLIRKTLDAKSLGDLEVIEKFLKYRRKRIADGTFQQDRFTLKLFVEHLRVAGVLKPPKMKKLSHADRIIQRFSQHLVNERGLSDSANHRYCGLAKVFLTMRFRDNKIRLRQLTAKDVYDFTLRYSRGVRPKTAAMAVSALRSFFRFLLSNGLITVDLAEYVPTIPNRKNADLPKYLGAEEIRNIVESCDRSTPTGRRNYALLLILARFGLRASEVRALTLDDIDWQSGMITVRGKGQRLNKFPLPKDVGAAIVDYIKSVRPRSSCRHLFLNSRPPIREITNSSTISSIVRRTIMRTPLRPPYCGAHVFRHSLGTQILRSGASLREVGHVLRHRGMNTTAIYAKVDFIGLNQAVLPWPTSRSRGAK